MTAAVPSPLAPGSMHGLHALICGASKGIGRATAFALAEAGASLTLVSRNAESLNEMARHMMEAGSAPVYPLAINLEDGTAIDEIMPGHLEAVGVIHIIINNAAGPPSGPLLEATDMDFLLPLRRHLFAAQRMVRHCLPGMVQSEYGRIINIVSTSVREPIPNLGVSNTVRGAMAGWSKTLSRELPTCVTINNVLPGFTNTGRLSELSETIAQKRGVTVAEVEESWLAQVPAKRLIDPSETAAAIAFLASPSASGIRGVSLAVDGGRMRSI
ncbi:MAG: SDR family oxidoreductase [Euryarchaeota archaeon]|nr:SDR family oxidoreductase [Euryarchaeota archaeon]MBT3971364.1 SDR family oxidoreductase [Euryarchaeota archaeon]